MMGSKIEVMIVDDSAVVRETLKELLEDASDISVMATAADPLIAAKKMETGIPDVIILDIEMPRMDGLSFLKKLMHQHPIPVVICSSKAEQGSNNVFRALEYGAVEIITKPKVGTKQFLEESRTRILDAVRAANLTRVKKTSPKPLIRDIAPKLTADAILPKAIRHDVIETTEKVVVVGASTGGTEALKDFLMAMPLDAPAIVIVQHMPEHFTAAFAERLNGICADDGEGSGGQRLGGQGPCPHRAGKPAHPAQAQRCPVLRGGEGRPAGLPPSAVGGRAVPIRGPLRGEKRGRGDHDRNGR